MNKRLRLSKFGVKTSLLVAISALLFMSAQIADAAEYLVSDVGMVIAVSGNLNVSYNSSGQRGGSTLVRVQQGQTFDCVARNVRATVASDYLYNFPWHISTVRANALAFPVSGGATVTVKPVLGTAPVIPTAPGPVGPGPAAD